MPWRRVTVGIDGLWIESSWLGRFGRFVPLGEIGGSVRTALWHGLARTEGKTIRLGFKPWGEQAKVDAIAAHVLRLQSQAQGTSPMPARVLSTLERGAKPLGRWLEELRALPSESSEYRVAAIPADVLREALVSPVSSVAARVGAAVALMAHEPDAGDVVARAAAAVARPATRRALLAVAEGRLTRTALSNALKP